MQPWLAGPLTLVQLSVQSNLSANLPFLTPRIGCVKIGVDYIGMRMDELSNGGQLGMLKFLVTAKKNHLALI